MSYLREGTLPRDVITTDVVRGKRRRHAIERAAQSALQRSSYMAVRGVDCEYDNGVLTLRGRLPSFFLKQVAQSMVSDRLGGVAVLDNQLEVTQLPYEPADY